MDNRERTEKQRIKAERQRQEDIALSKVLYWFGGAVVMEVLLFLTKRYYIDFDTSEWSVNLAYGIGQALKFIPIAALILAVLGFVWCFSRRRQGKGGVLLWAVSSFLLGLAVCSFLVYRFNPSGADLLTYLVPVTAVLALIYYLYQREFFTVALTCTAGIVGLWALFKDGGRGARTYALLVLLGIFLVAVAVLARVLQSRGGVLSIKGKSLEVLPKNANYALLYITCAVIAAALVAALALGAVVTVMVYYAVPVAWLLIMAVYYTVKLM